MTTRPMVASMVALVVLCAGSADAQRKARVTGMFTNMRYIEEAGDVVGTEVFVVAALEGDLKYFVFCQIADGKPSAPVLVPAVVKDNTLEFTMPHPWEWLGTFRGTVTDRLMVGQFTGSKDRLELPRRNSYWQ